MLPQISTEISMNNKAAEKGSFLGILIRKAQMFYDFR